MPSPLIERMRALCALPGPPGREGAVREAIAQTLLPHADRLRQDAFGNLIAQQRAGEGAPHLLLQCHMDEVGVVVTAVEPGGAVRFDKVGLLADGVFPGREIDLLAEDGALHRGIVSIRGGHQQFLHGEDRPAPAQMWIEMGGLDGAAVRKLGIGPGAMGVFHSPFAGLGGGAWKSKAIDNRSGCALCIEAFLNARPLAGRLRLSAAFCVQEEVGARGASVLSVTHTLEGKPPDLAVVLDGVVADGPVVTPDGRGLRMGAGPVLRRFDHHPVTFFGHIPPPEAVAWVKETARAAGVPLQEDAYVGSFTDAATLSRSLPGGLQVVNLNLPRRFAHTPVEMFLESDLEALSALVGALMRRVADGDFPAPGRDYKGRNRSAFG